jgi:glycine cleavage system aminomethyltransferase T
VGLDCRRRSVGDDASQVEHGDPVAEGEHPVDKGEFIGREVLARQKAEGVRRKLACLTLADPLAVALGGEPVRARAGGGAAPTPRQARAEGWGAAA